jgi:hypothetical protein
MAIVGSLRALINIHTSYICCKIFIPSIAGTGKASYCICTYSIHSAIFHTKKFAICWITLINVGAKWLGNISLTVQAWGTVFIIPAAYLVVVTYIVSLIADPIATGIPRSKAIC